MSSMRGAQGEEYAVRWLEERGYQVLQRNYQSRWGEIDIIAADETYLIFIEVKTRGAGTLARPGAWVDRKKQQKILKTALLYLSETGEKRQPRFDVVEIMLKPGDSFAVAHVEHVVSAFEWEDGYAAF